MPRDQLAERVRQLRAELGDDLVEIGEQLGATRVGVGEQQVGAFAERGHPLAGGALRQALSAEQGIHLGGERRCIAPGPAWWMSSGVRLVVVAASTSQA